MGDEFKIVEEGSLNKNIAGIDRLSLDTHAPTS